MQQQQQVVMLTGAGEGDDLNTRDDDSVLEKRRGWWGKLESKLKQVLCFQDSQKKIMYCQHFKEKEARARQVRMMHHLGMTDISNGSEKIITPEEKWVEEHFQSFQWTARD
jgi:hypothetical protein